jgi:hypothetical protein
VVLLTNHFLKGSFVPGVAFLRIEALQQRLNLCTKGLDAPLVGGVWSSQERQSTRRAATHRVVLPVLVLRLSASRDASLATRPAFAGRRVRIGGKRSHRRCPRLDPTGRTARPRGRERNHDPDAHCGEAGAEHGRRRRRAARPPMRTAAPTASRWRRPRFTLPNACRVFTSKMRCSGSRSLVMARVVTLELWTSHSTLSPAVRRAMSQFQNPDRE